jgi:hypothetical protein
MSLVSSRVKEVVMTTMTKTKVTQTTRKSAAHRTKPSRRSVHRSHERGAGSQERTAAATRVEALGGAISVHPAFLREVRDWTVLAGASLVGWLTAAIAFGVV